MSKNFDFFKAFGSHAIKASGRCHERLELIVLETFVEVRDIIFGPESCPKYEGTVPKYH